MYKHNSILAALAIISGLFLLVSCDHFNKDVQPSGISRLQVNDDHYITEKNQGIYLNVLANDSIVNRAVIRFVQPQNGTLQADSVPGRLYYMPNRNFTGTDRFIYQACIENTCFSAQVTVLVKPNGTLPCTLKAYADTVTLIHNTPAMDTVSVYVLRNDEYCPDGAVPVPQLIFNPQQPQYGMVEANGSGSNFRFIYAISGPIRNTTDKFNYRICQVVNGEQVCSDAEVVIQIR